MLRRLGLELSAYNFGNKCKMDINYILPPYIVPELPGSLEKRYRFNISNSPADLDDCYIDIRRFPDSENPVFYLICNVGNDLDSPSEVAPIPLFLNNCLLNLPCGNGICP